MSLHGRPTLVFLVRMTSRQQLSNSSAAHAARFMDTLGELSGSGSDSDEEAEAPEDHAAVKPAKKQKAAAAVADPAPEELEELGYKSGPSVLFVPEPQSQATPSWDW